VNTNVTVCGPFMEESVSQMGLSGDLRVPVSKRATVRPLAGRRGGRWQRCSKLRGVGHSCHSNGTYTPHGDCIEDKAPSCIDNSYFILVNTTLFPADGAAV
jgi:hypothetical protein